MYGQACGVQWPRCETPRRNEAPLQPNKRMQLAGAPGLMNVGLCAVKESPQLMRGPLGRNPNPREINYV
jgi:hypothetical protein